MDTSIYFDVLTRIFCQHTKKYQDSVPKTVLEIIMEFAIEECAYCGKSVSQFIIFQKDLVIYGVLCNPCFDQDTYEDDTVVGYFTLKMCTSACQTETIHHESECFDAYFDRKLRFENCLICKACVHPFQH